MWHSCSFILKSLASFCFEHQIITLYPTGPLWFLLVDAASGPFFLLLHTGLLWLFSCCQYAYWQGFEHASLPIPWSPFHPYPVLDHLKKPVLPRKILELASEQGLFSSWNYFKFMNLQLSTLLPRELTPPVIQHPWSWQSTNITIFSPSLTLLLSLFPSISSQNSNGLSLALPCLTILTR